MRGRRISEDMRERIYILGTRPCSLPVSDLTAIFGVCEQSVRNIIRQYNEWGTHKRLPGPGSGPKTILQVEDLSFISQLVRERPGIHQDEIAGALSDHLHFEVSAKTVQLGMDHAGLTRKKLSVNFSQRSEEAIAAFCILMDEELVASQCVFIDETRVDDKSFSRRYGYSGRGSRAVVSQTGVRGKSTTLIAALSADGIRAKCTVDGSSTADIFVDFVVNVLLPNMQEGENLIMDNARIHHDDRVLFACAACGVRPVFLPPYCPFLNPIEEAFSVIKAEFRYLETQLHAVYDRHALILLVCDVITGDKAKGFIRHSGYTE